MNKYLTFFDISSKTPPFLLQKIVKSHYFQKFKQISQLIPHDRNKQINIYCRSIFIHVILKFITIAFQKGINEKKENLILNKTLEKLCKALFQLPGWNETKNNRAEYINLLKSLK